MYRCVGNQVQSIKGTVGRPEWLKPAGERRAGCKEEGGKGGRVPGHLESHRSNPTI